jgi:hypothetical protein
MTNMKKQTSGFESIGFALPGILAAMLGLAVVSTAFGQDQTSTDGTGTTTTAPANDYHHGRGHHHRRGGFGLGLCVGQTLGSQGVTLPARVPGQKPAWDAATKTAFQSAMTSCKAKFKANRTTAGSSGEPNSTGNSQ